MSYFGSGQNPNHGLIRPGAPMQAPGGNIIQPQFFNQIQFSQADGGGGFDHGAGGHIQILQAPPQQQPPQANFPLNLLADQLVSQISGQNPNLLNSMGLQGLGGGFTPVQQNMQQVGSATQSSASQQQPKQKVFTGSVTKTHDNFGFIDEDVFFQMSVVKGPVLPKAGDRVLVEADYNANMPFKWNATRVQIVNMASGGGTSQVSAHQPMTTASIPRSMPPPPIISNTGRGAASNANNHHSGSSASDSNFNHGSIMSNPHFGQQHQTQNPNTSGAGGHGMYGQPPRGNPSQPPPQQSRVGRIPPMQMGGGHPQPYHPASSANSQSYQSSHAKAEDRPGPDRDRDVLDSIKDRGRERDRSRERVRSRTRSRSRSRSRDRRDRSDSGRDPRRESDRRDRDRRRSPARSPPRRSSREKDRRRDRSRDRDEDRRRRERSREKDRSRSDNKESGRRKDSLSVSVSSPASSSSRKRSHSRDRDSKFSRDSLKPSLSRAKSRSPSKTKHSSTFAFDAPKVKLDTVDFDVVELKRRYRNIPSVPQDLFMAKACWSKSFSIMNFQPICLPSLASPVHIFRKHTDKINLGIYSKEKNEAGDLVPKVEKVPDEIEPNDTNPIFSVKVLLLSTPEKQILFQKCCGLADDNASRFALNKLIGFIVGVKTTDKNEPTAIGGTWSPSLDGENPQSDLQVLINTARRTFKTFTGVDLGSCTTWYRFMELYYKRDNGVLETVVYFLPDTSACTPTPAQWSAITSAYNWVFHGDEKKEEQKPAVEQKELGKASDDADAAVVNKDNTLKTSKDKPQTEESTTAEDTTSKTVEPTKGDAPANGVKEDKEGGGAAESLDTASTAIVAGSETGSEDSSAAAAVAKENVTSNDVEMKEEPKSEPEKGKETSAEASDTPKAMDTSTTAAGTEVSPRLNPADPRHMNVAKLKDELACRNLSTKGLKAQLLERLLEALEDEKDSQDETVEVKPELPKIPEVTTKIAVDDKAVKSEATAEEKVVKVVESEAMDVVVEKEPEMENIEVLVPFAHNLDEKAKKSWERRYQLPSKPQVLIHPSNKTKDFDCTQVLLSSLIEFSSSDKPIKEPTFELLLFAQFFREMLQYNCGLQIFKQLVTRMEIGASESNEKESEKPETEEKKPAVVENEKGDGSSDPKKRKLSTEDAVAAASKKVTIYPDLLFSFAYFDSTHEGSVQASDLEELFLALGLGLSRSEVMRMIQKVVPSKGKWRYRDWTDKLSGAEAAVLTEEENLTVVKKMNNLIKGNRVLLPVFVYPSEENLGNTEESKADGSDIPSLRKQLRQIEQERLVQAATLNVAQNTLVQSKNQVAELTRSNEGLTKELTRTKESLKKLDAESRTQRGSLDTLRSALESHVARVHHLIKLPTPKNLPDTDSGFKSGAGSASTSSPKSTEDN